MTAKRRFLQKPLTLVVAALYFLVFIFSTIAADSKSTFLSALKERFTKTPYVDTFGEQIMDFVFIFAPLLLSVAFLFIFFLHKQLPVLSSTVLLVAALVTLSGITVFVCLNTYNILETFNAHANAVEFAADNEPELYNILLTLVPYQIFLIIYAGSLVSFSMNIKGQTLGNKAKSGGAFAFSLANLILAVWHLGMIISPLTFVTNYFNTNALDKGKFIICEVALVLCFAATHIFSLLYGLSAKKCQKENP